ncbi:hypothetical protein HZC53_00280 [Candidatus Uhrbacteria bacterium]|nr:hypothetical protein [Candidatus Uhrbacteria bacterium]
MEDEAKHEILEAVSLLAETVQELSDKMDDGFEKVNSRIGGLDARVNSLDSKTTSLESRLGRIEATMVTKNYLDDKLGDLKGDMVSMMRKEDRQVGRLVDVLTDKKVLTAAESRDVRSFRPFP